MTILFIALFLVFGFLAVRHFRTGRIFWALITAIGCLLMAGAVWVDFQRASGTAENSPAGSA